MNWRIVISKQDDWWKFSSGSVFSGALNPGEYSYLNVEVDRTGLADGEYNGSFVVESWGSGYAMNEKVKVVMYVGGEVVVEGPELINLSTNTGLARDQIQLTFDKTLDAAYAGILRHYSITPSVPVSGVTVLKDRVVLKTGAHLPGISYTVKVSSIKDRNGVESTNLSARCQFYLCCAGPDLARSGTELEYQWDNLFEGKPVFTDKNIVLSTLPPGFESCAFLRTNSEDAENANLKLSFTINCDESKVYLAFDPKRTADWKCPWLDENFNKTEITLPIKGLASHKFLALYESKQTFQPGDSVTLFQNGAPSGGGVMYQVLVKGIQPTLAISGKVRYYASPHPVEQAVVALHSEKLDLVEIDSSGKFRFSGLIENKNYSLAPTKSGDVPRATILMYDASLTAQLALKLLTESSASQLLAADVNRDGQVTFGDAQSIARFAVGLPVPAAPGIGQWIFNPAQRNYSGLNASWLNQDFAGIVLGDVDGNWGKVCAEMRAPVLKSNPLLTRFRENQNPRLLGLEIDSERDLKLASFQFQLEFNPAELKYAGFRMSEGEEKFHFFVNDKNQGRLELGGFSEGEQEAGKELLQIFFEVVSKIQIKPQVELKNFSINGETTETDLTALYSESIKSVESVTCRLSPNYPNPFNPETSLFYELNYLTPQPIVLQIYNIRGELVKTLVETTQAAGNYSVHWNGANETGVQVSSGVYLTILKTPGGTQTRKILKIK